MGRIKKYVTKGVGGLLLLLSVIYMTGMAARADGFYENSFLSFSPDGGAWTVMEALPRAGDATNKIDPACWYPMGETIVVRQMAEGRELAAGEHFYRYARQGVVPIQRWEVVCRTGKCIHNDTREFHHLPYIPAHCGNNYFSGWNAYCADCGEKVVDFNLYMSREKINRITAIDTDLDYYYLCPTCGHMEQGTEVRHMCKEVSANRYRVRYMPNGGNVAGFMQSSFHMYGNACLFEGEEVTPIRTLSRNTYSRPGYLFAGWNSKPDGSGEGFLDGQEILNLTAENYDPKEDTGTVNLYAQWVKVTGMLDIDPAGGSYYGNSGITTVSVGYDESYILRESYVVPPKGVRVQFDVMGGIPLEDIRTEKCFSGWRLNNPAKGALSENRYRFLGENGDRDSVTAVYRPEGIVLPEPKKEGFGFGGWYYDRSFSVPAGGAGDLFLPENDMVLYAQWVELVLDAKVNLKDCRGKGAVDLKWSQPDGNQKVYLLFQRAEGEQFQKIGETEGEETDGIRLDYNGSGRTEYFPVTQTGFYRLGASGAQGQDFEEHRGGLGGMTEGVFYLTAGDVIEIEVGMHEGANAGGMGEQYGNGGGRTVVRSKDHGTLLVAGGGGGATKGSDGGAGGTEEGLRPDGMPEGENGAAGGGAGWVGGRAGIYEQHIHTQECLHIHVGDEQSGGECYREEIITKNCHVVVSGPRVDWAAHAYCDDCLRAGRGNDTMHPKCWRIEHFGCGKPTDNSSAGWWVCSVCGKEGYRWGSGSNPPIVSDHTFQEKVYVLNCEREYDCGNPPGKVIASCGGSNHVNTELAVSYLSEQGCQSGDGNAFVESLNIGFRESNELLGAYAPDLAAPRQIDADTVRMKAAGDQTMLVLFDRPEDRGTRYYHQAKSYLAGKEEVLSSSNITMTDVVTGIAGYYYLVDGTSDTVIETQDGRTKAAFCAKEEIGLLLGTEKIYLHIAPLDRAGNLGETVSVEIDPVTEEIAWGLATDQMTVSSRIGEREYGSVAAKGDEENTYFVRADGRTPFLLSFSGTLLGFPRFDYQIDSATYDYSLADGAARGEYTVLLPHGELALTEQLIGGESLGRSSGGSAVLQAGMYAGALRMDGAKSVQVMQSFSMGQEYDARKVWVIPAVGVHSGMEVCSSDRQEDALNGVWLIGDAKEPEILGLEEAERLLLAEREESKMISIQARDDGSGLAAFRVTLRNLDNGAEAIYYAGEDGRIQICMEKDNDLFEGDLQLKLWAEDRVGNVAQMQCGADDFGLRAELIRVLPPHTPIFKRGESGLLKIKARGYVERIEVDFPEEFLRWNPELDQIYSYDSPQAVAQESILFMVPLELEEDGEYSISVRAYKGGESLEEKPALCTLTVVETVLAELRTRLR